MFIVRDRETGTRIDRVETYDEALELVEEYEAEDKKDNCYTEDFYEIVEVESEVIYITAKSGCPEDVYEAVATWVSCFNTVDEAVKSLTGNKAAVVELTLIEGSVESDNDIKVVCEIVETGGATVLFGGLDEYCIEVGINEDGKLYEADANEVYYADDTPENRAEFIADAERTIAEWRSGR